VNGPEIQHLIEQDLRRAVARIVEVPRPDPLAGSPWVAMSVLQKAIRRGNKDLALRAAATLLRDAPDRLWRRLGCIAAEDIGLGDLDAVGIATAALAGVRKRADLGGAWPVACAVVAALADAPKCRAADDLLMICELHPANARQRIEFRHRSSRELAEIVCGAATIEKRAVALWCALGGGPRHVGLRRRRSETQTVFDRLCEAGWPTTLVEVARASFNRTGEPLGPLLALLARQPKELSRGEAEDFPPEVAIDGTPGWAFDVYTREGRAAFARFLETDARSAEWLRRHVKPSRRMVFLGHLVFRVEGGLVNRRLRWPLGDRLRRQGDLECSGPECRDASEVLELVRADIPILNEARAAVCGGQRQEAGWPG
jgi:hypothetical protein